MKSKDALPGMEGHLFYMGKVGACSLKMAPLMIKPSKPPQGAKGKPQNRASPVGNAPLLPPVAASSPEGQISPMLTCRDMWYIAQYS